MNPVKKPQSPWAMAAHAVAEVVDVSAATGLATAEAKRRLGSLGPNVLRRIQTRSRLRILLDQFRGLLVGLLAAATVVAFVFGEWVEGIAIACVLVLNAAIGFVTEVRARKSVEALYKMRMPMVRVRRSGQTTRIAARDVVIGDILLLEGGDVVIADARLIRASRLLANESTFTGESAPVSKQTQILDSNCPLASRANMLFKGTSLTRGSCEAVVVATGMDTELGHISRLVEEAKEEITPLERRLNKLGQGLVWVTFVIAAIVAIVGIATEKPMFLALETAIALAVATVPEGLPIIATLALARGMHRMAVKNALVNRLSAVETLGATSILCADKTGTLTVNRMTVEKVITSGTSTRFTGQGHTAADGELAAALEVAALCNNAALGGDDGVGDPLEVALLRAAEQSGIHQAGLRDMQPVLREHAFDPETKMMATVHRQHEDGFRFAIKGAPEAVFRCATQVLCDGRAQPMGPSDHAAWAEKARALAKEGLRVIALGQKVSVSQDDDPYCAITLVGLVGLLDPPREDVSDAVLACRNAGIRIVMITGDHPETALSIAKRVGIAEDSECALVGDEISDIESLSVAEKQTVLACNVFARVSPKQKLGLIAAYQQTGAIVAMTGDGVNDAPALRKADIGVAMGARGTDVAREAADLVLRDDSLSTIAYAVGQGRVIFDNIRSFVVYLLSCNLSEVLVIGLATAVGAPLPLLPLQILFLNLVTDVFPALALGAGEGDPRVLQRKPRDPKQAIIPRRLWRQIAFHGGLITTATLTSFGLALGWLVIPTSEAVTVAFLTLAFAQLWHVLNMRSRGTRILRNEITQNPYIWGALAFCTGLLAASIYWPPLAGVLRLVPPSSNAWLLIAIASVFPVFVWQTGALLRAIWSQNGDQSPQSKAETSGLRLAAQ